MVRSGEIGIGKIDKFSVEENFPNLALKFSFKKYLNGLGIFFSKIDAEPVCRNCCRCNFIDDAYCCHQP